MVTTVMWCWLVIHSSNDPATDFHQEVKVKGTVLKEYTEANKLNFADDFKTKHIDPAFNEAIRVVRDNDCLYAE